MSSEWFDYTEPSQTSLVQRKQGLSHAFGVVRLHRTCSNHFSAEKARCIEVFHMSSVWFDYTEPPRTLFQNKGKIQ